MEYFTIGEKKLTIELLSQIRKNDIKIRLSKQAEGQIQVGRKWLEEQIKKESRPVYGVNTGFGSLCNIRIDESELDKLQVNLVRSHNCGTGDMVPIEIVRIMLLLKIRSLSLGHSGIRPETLNRLIFFYNQNALPVIRDTGSLGASGDLAPLAALSLPLIGEGEMWFEGQITSATEVHKKCSIKPLTLKAKEGLALLNGTQFMSAYGVYLLEMAFSLYEKSNLIAAASLDAFDCKPEPFDPLLHNIRSHEGQVHTAKSIRGLLKDSALFNRSKEHVQDPYSFRCIPQVHGASYDVFMHVRSVIEKEINSVTDNPNIFPDKGKILSGGNFHGQPLAMALDYLTIAIAELGSISDRRTYLLLSGERGLPEFLIAKPGLNSGLMIPQYTAASLVSKNKQYCTPASIDTIPSSNGQEDHVSMGANAAVKSLKVAINTEKILSIEWLTACQALYLRKEEKTAPQIEALKNKFHKVVPPIDNDRDLGPELEKSMDFIRKMDLTEHAN